jgi:hypothetical protein
VDPSQNRFSSNIRNFSIFCPIRVGFEVFEPERQTASHRDEKCEVDALENRFSRLEGVKWVFRAPERREVHFSSVTIDLVRGTCTREEGEGRGRGTRAMGASGADSDYAKCGGVYISTPSDSTFSHISLTIGPKSRFSNVDISVP